MWNNLDRIKNDYLLSDQSDSDDEDEIQFDDVSEGITQDKYNELFM